MWYCLNYRGIIFFLMQRTMHDPSKRKDLVILVCDHKLSLLAACLDGLALATSSISSYKWTNELTTSS